jgi:tetratricopeptide (TPR) repeat protein
MQIRISLPIVTVCTIAILLTGCTAASRKARHSEQAERFFKSGEYDKAKVEYLNAIKIDPSDAHAYAQIGAIWAEEGAPLRGGAFLVKALELAPDDTASRVNLARVYLAAGGTSNARKEAMTVLEKAPSNGEALLALVDTSQTPEEISATEQQLEKFPQKDSVYYYLAVAGIAAKKSELPAAETALQRAIAADSNSAAAHSALAALYLSRKDNEKAGAELEKAAKLAKPRSPQTIKFAQFMVQNGAPEEAKAFLTNITKQAPDFLPAWPILAKIAITEKKYDDALKLVENALSRDPENIDARLVQAETWVAKGETKKAMDSIENLDRAYPRNPIIKYALARVYARTNNLDQAIAAVDQAANLSPHFLDAVLFRAELHLRIGDGRSVVDSLSALVKQSPDLFRAKLMLAEAYRSLGQLDDAAAILREQINASPQNAAPYRLLGVILQQQNKITEAREALNKAAQLAPDNPSSLEQLIDLDIANKNYAAGHRRVDEVLQKQPTSAVAYYLRGKLYLSEKKFDLAQTALLKAIDLDSNLSSAYDLLSPAFLNANNPSQALNQMNAVLAKKPDDLQALLAIGMIYSQMKEFNKARDAYERVIAVSPTHILALNNLAYIYAEKFNDLKRGSELAQKARSIAPTNPSVLDTLGWITYKQGDYQQAAELLKDSVAKSPDNAEIQFHLGMAEYMMGRTDAARAALKTAVGSAIDFDGKEEARRRLASLGTEGSAGQNLSAAEIEASLKEQPNDPAGLCRLGDAYEKQGEVAKAADAYERALKANPNMLPAAMKLAQLNAGSLKNPDKALQYAKKARELAPTDPRATAAVGSIAFQLGNYTWAYSLLQEANRQLPNDPVVLRDLAWAAYSLGKVAEARQTMQNVLSSAPTSPQSADAKTFLSMTGLSMDGNSVSASEAEVNSVLTAAPGYVPALAARAAIQAERGDSVGAEATYRQVLQRFPDFAPAQRDLAAILVNDPTKRDTAYDLATKARRTTPADPLISIVLGRVSYERKDFGRAIQLFQESARERPLDAKSLYYLGMAQAQAKRNAEAKETLNRALRAGLSETEASEAKRALAGIGGT